MAYRSTIKPTFVQPAALCEVTEDIEIDGILYEADWNPSLYVPCKWLKTERSA